MSDHKSNAGLTSCEDKAGSVVAAQNGLTPKKKELWSLSCATPHDCVVRSYDSKGDPALVCEKDANNLRRILLALAAMAVVYVTVVNLYEFMFGVGYCPLW